MRKFSVILASTSPYRKMLLTRLLSEFEPVSPQIDEASFKDQFAYPAELASRLALEKALDVSKRESYTSALVIGGDQVAVLDGKILGKPGNRENAIAQLQELSGKTQELLTAVAVVCGDRIETILDITSMSMRTLSSCQIELYVDRDQPWDCAGSYKFEAGGVALFERVESEDLTAITGLPLLKLSAILHSFGVPIPA